MAKFSSKVQPKPISLPDKASDLILLALKDLRAVERSKKYNVFMSVFHAPDYTQDGVCTVCLAGAVIAKSLKSDSTRSVDPDHFDDDIRKKLYALDRFRLGMVKSGLNHLGIKTSLLVESLPISDYDDSHEDFHNDMKALAAQLKALNL